MDKKDFNALTIPEQIEHINTLLNSGQSLRTIASDLTLSKTTIRDRFTKVGYQFNSTLKAYISTENEIIQIPIKSEIKPLAKQKNDKNIAANVSSDNSLIRDNNIVRNVSSDINGNMVGNKDNSIIISKSIDNVKPKRTSYYLNVSTIRTIEQLAKQSNKGISEFLQDLLNATLPNVKIE